MSGGRDIKRNRPSEILLVLDSSAPLTRYSDVLTLSGYKDNLPPCLPLPNLSEFALSNCLRKNA